jgi:hypothetical protein
MAKHLLNCECGRNVVVDTAQAGDSVACECGKTMAVPTLRQLRQLPLATPGKPADATSSWGVRQGLIAACLIVATLCAIVAAISYASQPVLPVFDPAQYTRMTNEQIERMSPMDAWRTWVNGYRNMGVSGFREFRHPATEEIQLDVNRHRLVQMAMLGAAGLAVVIAAGAAMTKSGSQGDR